MSEKGPRSNAALDMVDLRICVRSFSSKYWIVEKRVRRVMMEMKTSYCREYTCTVSVLTNSSVSRLKSRDVSWRIL